MNKIPNRLAFKPSNRSTYSSVNQLAANSKQLTAGYTLTGTRLRRSLVSSTLSGYTLIRTLRGKNHVSSTPSGYTLIEILIGITIIGIVFGSGYVAFREFARRQALTSAVRGVVADIRLAQTQAVSGVKPDSQFCSGTNQATGQTNYLMGYYFVAYPSTSTTSSYTVSAVCSGGLTQLKVVNLPAGISFTGPQPISVLFKVLGQGTDIPIATTRAIGISAFGRTQSITVSSEGNIE